MGAQPLERNKVGPPCKLIRSGGCIHVGSGLRRRAAGAFFQHAGIVSRHNALRGSRGRGWAMFGPIARILSG